MKVLYIRMKSRELQCPTLGPFGGLCRTAFNFCQKTEGNSVVTEGMRGVQGCCLEGNLGEKGE